MCPSHRAGVARREKTAGPGRQWEESFEGLTVTRSKAEVKCYHCGKAGHIKRNCRLLKQKRPSRNES